MNIDFTDITDAAQLDMDRPLPYKTWFDRDTNIRLETNQDSIPALYKMNEYLTDALYDGNIDAIDILFFDMMVFTVIFDDGHLVLMESGNRHNFRILFDALEFIVDKFFVEV